MKSYNQFRSAQDEITLNRWKEYLESLDEETIHKIEEWNSLEEETRQSIIESGELELDEKWAGLGKVFKNLPGIRTVYGLGSAAYRAAKGDYTGAGLSLGSAIPGPVGWGFVGADIARDMAKGGGPKGAVDRRTSALPKTQPQTPGIGDRNHKNFDPSKAKNWSEVDKSGKPITKKDSSKKKSPYTFNFPKNFKTSSSYGSAKDDAYNTKFNVNRKGVDTKNNATTYKSRTRAQVKADDYADMQASKRSRNRR